jgi:hypothetical protein
VPPLQELGHDNKTFKVIDTSKGKLYTLPSEDWSPKCPRSWIEQPPTREETQMAIKGGEPKKSTKKKAGTKKAAKKPAAKKK